MATRKKTVKKASGTKAKKVAGKYLNMTAPEFAATVGVMDQVQLRKFFTDVILVMAGSIVSQAEKEAA